MTPCTFPRCPKPHFAKGYCVGHYRQHMKDQPLRPLRQRPEKPLVRLSLRVPEPVREAAQSDTAGARRALVEWHKKRGGK